MTLIFIKYLVIQTISFINYFKSYTFVPKKNYRKFTTKITFKPGCSRIHFEANA